MNSCVVVNQYKEDFDVYIGRAGRGEDGYFGNPIRLNVQCPFCDETHTEGGDTIPCFENYFLNRLDQDDEFRERVHDLYGKKLGCFCKPKPCHGDVIAEYVNGMCGKVELL